MPGIVIASRRWMIGSDDFIIPGCLLLIAHLVWLSVYISMAALVRSYLVDVICPSGLLLQLFGQAMIIAACAILEICLIKVSFNGSILETDPRRAINYLIWIRLVLFLIEIVWEFYALVIYFQDDSLNAPHRCHPSAQEKIIGLKASNVAIILLFVFIIWASYDPAGRSWVKAKTFQESLKDPKIRYRRSKNSTRNWRQREATRKYEKTWDNRCRAFCCFLTLKDGARGGQNFTEVAKLLSDFFRDLDVVPSDVVAGLSLMRVQQKATRIDRVQKGTEEVLHFLSGVPITAETKFLDLSNRLVANEMKNMIHYFNYSLAIYGWPMYVLANSPTKWCRLFNHAKCCANVNFNLPTFGCIGRPQIDVDTIVEGGDFNIETLNTKRSIDPTAGDNCCLCNQAAIEETCYDHNYRMIYITYQVDVEKPPFFVAVDLDKMAIVISIRGTLSLYDVLTDLNAENEVLPLRPRNESFFGHKGMVAAAHYIYTKLLDLTLLERANRILTANDVAYRKRYPIVIVGHSLGAGTAAILAILLRPTYHDVICFAFAPPGGLLSEEAMEYSKEFVVSIVLGKDIVPRLGLHQMEKLRFDLIKSMKRCHMSKWVVITRSCLFGHRDFKSMNDFLEEYRMEMPLEGEEEKASGNDEDEFKKLSIHPNDESVSLTVHTPLYPPGSIIHLVKVYPSKDEQIINKHSTKIQALWSENKSYNEILISPTMIKDHMPDRMLMALESLLSQTTSPKPTSSLENTKLQSTAIESNSTSSDSSDGPQKILIETSFTDGFHCRNLPNVDDNKYGYLDEKRLQKIKTLVKKGMAPIATPETDSLGSVVVTLEQQLID